MKLGEHFESNTDAPNHSRTGFSNLDMVARSFEPALKGVGRWNLELVALISRRSQAWLAVPTRLGGCRSPLDVAHEQLSFWHSAVSDYSHAAQRLAAAFGAWAVIPGLNGAAKRDYMTMQDPPTPAAKRSDRKAA